MASKKGSPTRPPLSISPPLPDIDTLAISEHPQSPLSKHATTSSSIEQPLRTPLRFSDQRVLPTPRTAQTFASLTTPARKVKFSREQEKRIIEGQKSKVARWWSHKGLGREGYEAHMRERVQRKLPHATPLQISQILLSQRLFRLLSLQTHLSILSLLVSCNLSNHLGKYSKYKCQDDKYERRGQELAGAVEDFVARVEKYMGDLREIDPSEETPAAYAQQDEDEDEEPLSIEAIDLALELQFGTDELEGPLPEMTDEEMSALLDSLALPPPPSLDIIPPSPFASTSSQPAPPATPAPIAAAAAATPTSAKPPEPSLFTVIYRCCSLLLSGLVLSINAKSLMRRSSSFNAAYDAHQTRKQKVKDKGDACMEEMVRLGSRERKVMLEVEGLVLDMVILWKESKRHQAIKAAEAEAKGKGKAK